ncbi:MAG: hypothetical protein EAZ23_12165 [Oscillatoriales cyanobacterium]|nr:MAG: hypothetical protein EAZ23_12165 [Oscillatoriales cyanobacterium]
MGDLAIVQIVNNRFLKYFGASKSVKFRKQSRVSAELVIHEGQKPSSTKNLDKKFELECLSRSALVRRQRLNRVVY